MPAETIVTKAVEEGRVYAHHALAFGQTVIEKTDPRIVHNAPSHVNAGSAIEITFTLVDFDGQVRAESGGTLSLEIEGQAIALEIVNGSAALEVELHVPITIHQQPPYFCDGRLEAFGIGVSS